MSGVAESVVIRLRQAKRDDVYRGPLGREGVAWGDQSSAVRVQRTMHPSELEWTPPSGIPRGDRPGSVRRRLGDSWDSLGLDPCLRATRNGDLAVFVAESLRRLKGETTLSPA